MYGGSVLHNQLEARFSMAAVRLAKVNSIVLKYEGSHFVLDGKLFDLPKSRALA